MCVCFWAYLTAVSDTPHLQAESASTQEEDLHVYKNNNAKSPFESSSHGSTGRAGAVLLSPAHPATPGWCIIPFAHGENKGVGVYFLRDLYSWQLFWGRKKEHSGQWDNVSPPFPKCIPEMLFWPGCFLMEHLSIPKGGWSPPKQPFIYPDVSDQRGNYCSHEIFRWPGVPKDLSSLMSVLPEHFSGSAWTWFPQTPLQAQQSRSSEHPSLLLSASSALPGWALIFPLLNTLLPWCSEPLLPFACATPCPCSICWHEPGGYKHAGWQGSLVASWTTWDGGRGPASLVLGSNLGLAFSSEDWSCDSEQPHLQGIYPPTLTYICCFKLLADALTSPVIEGTQHLLQQ